MFKGGCLPQHFYWEAVLSNVFVGKLSRGKFAGQVSQGICLGRRPGKFFWGSFPQNLFGKTSREKGLMGSLPGKFFWGLAPNSGQNFWDGIPSQIWGSVPREFLLGSCPGEFVGEAVPGHLCWEAFPGHLCWEAFPGIGFSFDFSLSGSI